MIVDNQAARVAGTNALAETGDKLSVNLSMPVMADLPPATPGMLVGVTINSEVFKGVQCYVLKPTNPCAVAYRYARIRRLVRFRGGR